MKIILLVSSLDAGGAERVATTLCNAWAARGDKVTLIATFSGGGTPFYDTYDNVETVYLADVVGVKRKNILSYIQRMLALRRLITDKAPDVIISFLSNVNVSAVLASAFLRIPLIICERTHPLPQSNLSLWMMFVCKLTYPFSDMLTTQTESAAEAVLNIYHGVRKVRAIPNPLPEGISSVCLAEERKREMEEEGWRDRKVLLSLGRLIVNKQVDDIISTFSALHNQFDDWDLHIYGDGSLRSVLQERICGLHMQQRIYLKGLTSDPWRVMASADAFVMTSAYEGFSNTLLEAMGVGLACITYDCPSSPHEITRGGIDAMLVPLNDQDALLRAMEKIMGDEAFRISLGIKARASVHHRFQLAAVLDRWDEVFKEVGVKM